jgi:hypothetical protein
VIGLLSEVEAATATNGSKAISLNLRTPTTLESNSKPKRIWTFHEHISEAAAIEPQRSLPNLLYQITILKTLLAHILKL